MQIRYAGPILFLSLLFAVTALLAQPHSFTRYDSLRGTLNSQRAAFDVHYYELSVKFNLEERSIQGNNNIHFALLSDCASLQIDLFANLSVDSILFNQKPLSYHRDSNHVFIHFPALLKKNTRANILFYYHGLPAPALLPPWQGGFIWKTDSLGRPWTGVACEGLGASSWWPLKDHLSDEPDSVRLNFEVPKDLFCVSNGTLEKITPIDKEFNRFTWVVHYPINSYNVTFNVGHYTCIHDTLRSEGQADLSLDYYVLDYHASIAKTHFQQVKKILGCFTKRFGPYPFTKDGYALVETSYWGMEHQGAISYGNHFKNDMADFDFIIVHETAHEWWGNSISVKDHGDMWIHEAFATYAESILMEDTYGYPTALQYLNNQKKKISNKEPIQGPLGVNYNGWEDADMYYKGAWMLHTLRNVIHNDSLWFDMLYQMAKKYEIKSVTTKELIDFINKFTQQNFTNFFETYLRCSAPPEFQYYFKEEKGKYRLFYRWHSCHPAFDMPFEVKINKSDKILNPRSKWKSILVESPSLPVFLPDKDRFYINLKRF